MWLFGLGVFFDRSMTFLPLCAGVLLEKVERDTGDGTACAGGVMIPHPLCSSTSLAEHKPNMLFPVGLAGHAQVNIIESIKAAFILLEPSIDPAEVPDRGDWASVNRHLEANWDFF